MLIQFPTTGSILLTGYDQNNQSILARQIAAETLIDGGTVLYCTDTTGEGHAAATALQARLRASGADLNAMQRYVFVDGVRQYLSAGELKARIGQRCPEARKPLIVRDLGSAMGEMLPGDHWLNVAEELAALTNCRVITAAHYSTAPRPAPDVSHYHADEVWVCQVGKNLGLTLHRRKPSDCIVKLAGRVMPYGVIDFENTEPELVQ